MFEVWRLKKVHAKYLGSCRSLKGGRDYLAKADGLRQKLVELILPVPLLGLHEDGRQLLSALHWLEENCRARRLDAEVICGYHRMLAGPKGNTGGRYRKVEVTCEGSSIPRPLPSRLPALMKQLDLKLASEQERLDAGNAVGEETVLEFAVDVYQRIGLIHPFVDANGRVSRLAMNHLLRRYGLGYVILPPLSKTGPHWPALQEAHRGMPEKLVLFAKSCMRKI